MTTSRIQPLDSNLLVQELDLLDGHLLGDGSVFKTGKDRTHAVYAQACKQATYLQWLIDNTGFLAGRKVYTRHYFDIRTQKTYEGYQIKSLSHEIFTQARSRWYPNGKKVLPTDLIITSRCLLRFYLDDGSWHKNGMYLATNDFNPQDVEVLQAKISAYCGFQLSIHKSGKKDVFKLFVKKSNRNQFIDIIGQSPVQCYSYKWGE